MERSIPSFFRRLGYNQFFAFNGGESGVGKAWNKVLTNGRLMRVVLQCEARGYSSSVHIGQSACSGSTQRQLLGAKLQQRLLSSSRPIYKEDGESTPKIPEEQERDTSNETQVVQEQTTAAPGERMKEDNVSASDHAHTYRFKRDEKAESPMIPQEQEWDTRAEVKVVQGQPSASPGEPPEPVELMEDPRITSKSYPPSAPQEPSVLRNPAEPLPSSTDTGFARFFGVFASISHRFNILTGTDYTSISLLRQQIATQETLVTTIRHALARAKTTQAHVQHTQHLHQKEVVQLLERKHSWIPVDLERYMSLIRSEHVNESAVTAAKRDVEEKERSLEEARQGLEKMERRMYHEEQVWSDTIRRNSTWVTVGLMGVNVGLLFVSLVAIEPWRRRRLVREVRGAVEGDRSASEGGVDQGFTQASLRNTENVVGGDSTSDLPLGSTLPPHPPSLSSAETTAVPPARYQHPQPQSKVPDSPSQCQSRHLNTRSLLLLHRHAWQAVLVHCKLFLANLFSDQPAVVPRIDLTITVLESFALGWAGMGIVVWAMLSFR